MNLLALPFVVYKETHLVCNVPIDQKRVIGLVNVAETNSNWRGHCPDWHEITDKSCKCEVEELLILYQAATGSVRNRQVETRREVVQTRTHILCPSPILLWSHIPPYLVDALKERGRKTSRVSTSLIILQSSQHYIRVPMYIFLRQKSLRVCLLDGDPKSRVQLI
jgi:hypothetical protein